MLLRPVQTDRLLIRQFEPGDWPAFHAYASDPGVMAYIPGGPLSQDQAIQFVQKHAGEQAEAFAVLIKNTDTLIGHLTFHPWFAPQTYELGWVINPPFQAQGYATEAARALLQYCFETLMAHRVIATCQPENHASYRVMEKLGMRREGHFQKCIYRGEQIWWDELFYAILETEWFGAARRG